MTKLPSNVVLLGLGSKARNGKDTTAELINKFEPNVHILHWADKLYEEVRNKHFSEHTNPTPLICLNEDDKEINCLRSCTKEGRATTIIYDTFTYEELPGFLKVVRQCPNYNYMISKDPILLQQWGTNLRRTYFGNDYWVDRTFEDIDRIAEENKDYDGLVWICVADTRFRNEAAAVRKAGGLYVDIIRLHKDGTRFITPDRDPDHPSEADLNDTKPDLVIKAQNTNELAEKTKDLILQIKQKRLIV